MRSRSLLGAALAPAVSLVLIACGGAAPDAPPPVAPSSPAPAAAAPPAPAASDEERAPTHAQKRPLEITSQCDHPVAYFVGEDPKAEPVGGSGKRTVDPLASLAVERRRDGTQTVWLLDEKSEPLIKVSITRGMKKIEVGRSCRTLDAR